MVESSPGSGTTFRVFLPATGEPEEHQSNGLGSITSRSGSILVIDDEKTVRVVARRALKNSGYSVWTAESGEQGIEILDAHLEISAVVLDLAMPVMTGDQVAPLLRSRRPDVPIILSSGYSESEAVRRFEGGSIAAFLQKPYTARMLVETVAAVLSNGAKQTS